MKKKLFFILIFSALILWPIGVARAICPVCTVAAAAGVGLSRWLHIDDTITGLWIGGLVVSSALWTVNWLRSKKIYFLGIELITLVLYFAAILIPFWKTDIIGHPANLLWGFDKLVLGIFIGSILFSLGVIAYPFLKSINKGKAHFHFEKVVLPLLPLVIMSLVFYLITKHH